MATTPIRLTTLGSRCVELRAVPAVLVAGGVQIEAVAHAGTVVEDRVPLSLTAGQAVELVEQVESVLLAVAPT